MYQIFQSRLNTLPNKKKLSKFCQSGEISPNVVTLAVGNSAFCKVMWKRSSMFLFPSAKVASWTNCNCPTHKLTLTVAKTFFVVVKRSEVCKKTSSREGRFSQRRRKLCTVLKGIYAWLVGNRLCKWKNGKWLNASRSMNNFLCNLKKEFLMLSFSYLLSVR